MSKFIICHPSSQAQWLAVAEILDGREYEKADYCLASQYDYLTYKEAVARAEELAADNGWTFMSDVVN
jgi:hypothetical protein